MYFTLGMQDVPSSNTSIENNPEIKPGGTWSFWPTVGFGLLVILAYFVGQIAIEAIFAVNSLISHRGESITQLTNVLSNGTALTTTIFVSTIIGVGFTLLFVHMRKGFSLKEYLALRPIKIITFFSMLGLVALLLFVSGFLLSGLGQTKFSEQLTQAYQSNSIAVIIAAAIFSPIFEEMFFRGFLFAGFRASKIGVTGAILLTQRFGHCSMPLNITFGNYLSSLALELRLVLIDGKPILFMRVWACTRSGICYQLFFQ